ncbi:hypothetical protein [Nannocystis sp.]|nr:hypothetical protein [Nannocystis sp.]
MQAGDPPARRARPRMVFGTDKIDADGFSGKFVVELRPDLAQG